MIALWYTVCYLLYSYITQACPSVMKTVFELGVFVS